MNPKIPGAALVVSVAAITATTILTAAPGAASEAAGGAVITMVGDYPVRYDRYGDGLTEAAHGTATTLTVDYSGAEPGTYTIDWSCGTDNGGKYRFTSQIPDDAPDGVIVYPIDTTEPSLSCTFLLQHDQVTGYFVTLLQLDPVLATSNFENPTGPVVYPRVHSDWWRAGFQTNSPAEITTSVRNQNGRLVFTGTSGTHHLTYSADGQARDWAAHAAWNGHRANGTLAPLGTYRVVIQVRSTRGSGAVRIGPLRVSVEPGRRPVTVRARQSGIDSRAIAAGGCDLAEQPGPGGVLALECGVSSGSSRALAKATWTFRVPRTAKLISWRIRGGVPADDNPDVGTVRRTLTHPKPTIFKVQMRLTGQRSYVVTDVILKYQYLK